MDGLEINSANAGDLLATLEMVKRVEQLLDEKAEKTQVSLVDLLRPLRAKQQDAQAIIDEAGRVVQDTVSPVSSPEAPVFDAAQASVDASPEKTGAEDTSPPPAPTGIAKAEPSPAPTLASPALEVPQPPSTLGP